MLHADTLALSYSGFCLQSKPKPSTSQHWTLTQCWKRPLELWREFHVTIRFVITEVLLPAKKKVKVPQVLTETSLCPGECRCIGPVQKDSRCGGWMTIITSYTLALNYVQNFSSGLVRITPWRMTAISSYSLFTCSIFFCWNKAHESQHFSPPAVDFPHDQMEILIFISNKMWWKDSR